MKRGCIKFETCLGITRIRSIQILALIGLLYMIFMTFEVPLVFMSVSRGTSDVSLQNDSFIIPQQLDKKEDLQEKEVLISVSSDPFGLIFDWRALISTEKDGVSEFNKSAITAFQLGEKLWEDLKSGKMKLEVEKEADNRNESSCPNSVLLSGAEFVEKGKVMVLPCGLKLGSHITVVGKPRLVMKDGDQNVMVSQFILELIGLKSVNGEDPVKILHYNPRLKGDWSGKPVIEQNTCYRQQWGTSIRCEGWKSKPDEETGECFNHLLI